MPDSHFKQHQAPLPDVAHDQLFRTARTYNAFEPEALPAALLREADALLELSS